MTTARTILNFMSSGLHSARPATPTLNTGEIAFYYETDTNHLFAYVSGGWTQIDSSSAGATIVQEVSAALSSHATGVTMTSGPVQGNLLIAMISDQVSLPTVNTGWTELQTKTGVNDDAAIMYKLAGASESTSQTPCSDTHQGTITIYEISGGSAAPFDIVEDYSGSAVTETAHSGKSSGLIIGVFVNRSLTGPTSITGTNVTADTPVSGVSRTIAPFHISPAADGANTATANYGTSQGGLFIAVSVG